MRRAVRERVNGVSRSVNYDYGGLNRLTIETILAVTGLIGVILCAEVGS